MAVAPKAVFTSTNGIGGYDLISAADTAFAYDYESSGKRDHIVCLRPGRGAAFVLKHRGSGFEPVYAQGDGGNRGGVGIGGYDLRSTDDRAFAFDYDSSGKLDHIVLMRPGRGAAFVIKRTGNTFEPVYAEGAGGLGIGGFDLMNPNDQAFAYDFDSSGKMDHVVLFRPESGIVKIVKRRGTLFEPVFQRGAGDGGIGGFDLKSRDDKAFAFDYDSSGKLDHIALYRPGRGAAYIVKRRGGVFVPVYAQGDGGGGIGGYDLKSERDRGFAFDYASTGKLDHMLFTRAARGAAFIVKNTGGRFEPVYAQGDGGGGIGGFDLQSPADIAFPYDYESSGKLDHIVLMRPGKGACWIVDALPAAAPGSGPLAGGGAGGGGRPRVAV